MALDKKIIGAIFTTAISTLAITILLVFAILVFYRVSKQPPAFAAPTSAWSHLKKQNVDDSKIDDDQKLGDYGWSYFMSEPDCLNACLATKNCNTYSYSTQMLDNTCALYSLQNLDHVKKADTHNSGTTIKTGNTS